MKVKQTFLGMYQECFNNKDLLGEEGGVLSVAPGEISVEEGWGPVTKFADEKLMMVASKLTGGMDFLNDDIVKIAERVASGYKDQEYWRELLFDYIDYLLLKEKEEIIQEERALLQESKEALKNILTVEAKEKKVIQSFASKIKEAGFKVNAEQLVANYLKMMQQDAQEAWKVLTTNPAMFSPILVKDAKGKVCLSAAQAVEENRRLARFLKGLRL